MSFTDRFILLPIRIYSTKQENLTGVRSYHDVEMRVLVFDIRQYFEDINDEDDREGVCLIMRNGDSSKIELSIEEFEKRLNEWWKKTEDQNSRP
jgi:hypothetical protein